MNKQQSMSLGRTDAQVSERQFLNQVYFWMAMGLALTGFIAVWMAVNPSLVVAMARNMGLFLILALVQFGIVIWLTAAISRISVTTATVGFGVYAALNGVLFSTLSLIYTGASIASTFFITAGMFGAISLYGYSTKRDLSSIGSFCFMALIGIILASLVNIFLKSPAVYWILTYAGIAVFVGLTAYDTQQLKQIHMQGIQSGEASKKLALLGALRLYLDFINLFLLLLRVLGRRR